MSHAPPEEAAQGEPQRRRQFRFFDREQLQAAPGLANDVDIWIEAAQLFVRLTPVWKKAVKGAANRFRTFRGPAREETMILNYRDKYVRDVLVVSPKKLAEHRGNRIAIHDAQRDIFVLLPEDVSQRIRAEAMEERQAREAFAKEFFGTNDTPNTT